MCYTNQHHLRPKFAWDQLNKNSAVACDIRCAIDDDLRKIPWFYDLKSEEDRRVVLDGMCATKLFERFHNKAFNCLEEYLHSPMLDSESWEWKYPENCTHRLIGTAWLCGCFDDITTFPDAISHIRQTITNYLRHLVARKIYPHFHDIQAFSRCGMVFNVAFRPADKKFIVNPTCGPDMFAGTANISRTMRGKYFYDHLDELAK